MDLSYEELSFLASHSLKEERIGAINYSKKILEENKPGKMIASAIIKTGLRDPDPGVRKIALICMSSLK